MPDRRISKKTAAGWAALLIIFFIGLAGKLVIFQMPHDEGDERIYRALVQQLDMGRGYTLQHSPILYQSWVAPDQYDKPLFFHPPGGIVFFWLMQRIAGRRGWALAQFISYALFFWSMALIAQLVLKPWTWTGQIVTALLAATSPIMSHVNTHYWLDGPMLGFSTLAVALLLWGLSRRSWRLVCLAGLVLGYASLIKVPAFVMAPGAVLLAWVTIPREAGQTGRVMKMILAFLAIGVAVQIPWELWQWRVVGSPFPAWAGKPSPWLVAHVRYIHWITLEVSPWMYITQLPLVLLTLGPSILLLGWQWNDWAVLSRGLALLAWIVVVLAAHITLGYIGYSKLLRYVILVSPATVMLFALTFSSALFKVIKPLEVSPRHSIPCHAWRGLGVLLVLAGGLGMAGEIAQGVKSGLVDKAADTVLPLWEH